MAGIPGDGNAFLVKRLSIRSRRSIDRSKEAGARNRGLVLSGEGGPDMKERFEMEKDIVPEKYGMVFCPQCSGRGFLVKQSGQNNVTLRRVCARCGGFGAVKKEEEVSN
jgi:hypothetical protein